MRILYVTAEWPTEDNPRPGPFLVRQVKHLRQVGVEVDVFPFRGRRKVSNYVGIYRDLQAKAPYRFI